MIVSNGEPKSPRSAQSFTPQAEATPSYWGGGGAQGFPSPELVLTARCQGEIPTDALSVRARGVQANPTETCEQPISVALAALRDNVGDYKSSALLVLSSLKFKLKAQVG